MQEKKLNLAIFVSFFFNVKNNNKHLNVSVKAIITAVDDAPHFDLLFIIYSLHWPFKLHHQLDDDVAACFADFVLSASSSSHSWFCFSAAASRCALISLTKLTTNGWLNFPSVESKNSWCVFKQLSRFSYSYACNTISRRSKSLTNFDSGVWFSSYS